MILRTTIIALLFAVTGCVYIPVRSPQRQSAQVGDDAACPLRAGVSDREAVLATFGKPNYSTQHDRAFGYLFTVKVGTSTGLLPGPCTPWIGTMAASDDDDVWLEFDEQGILRRVEKQLIKKNHNDCEAAWRSFVKSVPDQVRTAQMLNQPQR